ncbi:hypothetical protein TMEC54S_01659 [Thauera mechernichensis]
MLDESEVALGVGRRGLECKRMQRPAEFIGNPSCRRLRLVVGEHDRADLAALLLDQTRQMRGAGRHAGLLLDEADQLDRQPFGEIVELLVMRNQAQRRTEPRPQRGQAAAQRILESGRSGLESGRRLGRQRREAVGEGMSNSDHARRRQVQVRVPLAMHMAAQRRVEAGRAQVKRLGGSEIPGLPLAQAGVGGCVERRRQPALLELGADRQHEVGPPQVRDHARTRIERVRIAVGRDQHLHIDTIAADRARDDAHRRRGGNHEQAWRLSQRGRRRQRDTEGHGHGSEEGFHQDASPAQKRCAGWLPNNALSWSMNIQLPSCATAASLPWAR